MAPGVFVAFGAGNHARLCYKLWKGEPVPAFVLDILAGSASDNKLHEKRDKYVGMGIQEFLMFDPFGARIPDRIAGYRLQAGRYRPVPPLPGARGYASDVLGLEFRADGDNLRIHDPVKGKDLRSHEEANARADRAPAETGRANALAAENARLRRRLARYESSQAS